MTRKKPTSKCTHRKGFTFKKTGTGVKRTCKLNCGFAVTDVARGISNHLQNLSKAQGKRKHAGKKIKEEQVVIADA